MLRICVKIVSEHCERIANLLKKKNLKCVKFVEIVFEKCVKIVIGVCVCLKCVCERYVLSV